MLSQREQVERLRSLIEQLPDPKKELIALRYVAGLSFPEIAKILNRKVDTVKKSLYRLEDKLKQQMEDTHAGQ